MLVDFIRFTATDDVELQGWLSGTGDQTAVLHVHGMSGNGYKNRFLDYLREAYQKLGVTFLTFDNRGLGIISHFPRDEGQQLGGSCFELFEESVFDIQGAIDFLKSKGKTKIILQGHSLGGSKVVNYLINQPDASVAGAILLAPTDMIGWANTDSKNQEYLDRAHLLIAQGKPTELVGAQCGLDQTPLSAQTYLSIQEAGTPVDIYGQRAGGALLGRVTLPMAIIYGDQDIGILQIDKTMDAWLARTTKILNPNTAITVIPGAPHSFRDHEDELATAAGQFVATQQKAA